jgi:mono/diheme cytochrome c family protein
VRRIRPNQRRLAAAAAWIRRTIACGSFGMVAAATAATPEPVDFSRDIQPLLAKRCVACHGPDTQESGLRLDDRTAATGVLESGSRAIVPGTAAESELLARITSTDPDLQMPPEGPRISAAQVAILRQWIDEGAEWKEHWAFRPVTRPAVPTVEHAGHGETQNPIDAFVTAGLARRGLPQPQPAPKAALLRRATYSVTGLPPTEAEMRDFLADDSPGAWERVVDRLLASPHYGEHWARHWLDLVRYADTNSFERDGNKPHAWRYRDYVIRAFNDDKPYDRFLVEQVAGDELPDPSADALVATGWYRLGVWDDEPADRLQARYDWLDDLVSTAGQTFLGLTLNCARCHDHKIDPLPQRDYYALLAFFENVTPMGERHINPAFIERPLPAEGGSVAAARDHEEELARRRAEARSNITAIEQRIKEHGEQALDDLARQDLANWKRLLADIDAQSGSLPRGLVVTEHGTKAPETFVFFRGNPHAEKTPDQRVEPGFPQILQAAAPEIVPVPAANSTGRRTALARWLASPENPLTARVMVNRIWQYHFGRGIVRSSSNFGLMGDAPTHPELLDWLASEFVAGGWKLKPLHKLILMSETYRAASAGDEAAAARDPLNDAFWRFDPRRLSAEELRDSIHVASGAFNPKMFGPGVFPDIPAEVKAGQSKPGDGWGTSPPEEQARRSVYIHVKRSLLTPLLADLDLADTDTPCPVRFTTTQPTQALGMMNGSFLQAQAKAFAVRARREALATPEQPGPADADTAKIVRRALEIALVRAATDAEVARGVALVDRLEDVDGVSPSRALELYCLMVLNTNEFAYLD